MVNLINFPFKARCYVKDKNSLFYLFSLLSFKPLFILMKSPFSCNVVTTTVEKYNYFTIKINNTQSKCFKML